MYQDILYIYKSEKKKYGARHLEHPKMKLKKWKKIKVFSI